MAAIADAELDLFRQTVNCAAVLERMAGWRLDVRGSTRRALKYRRGAGEIIIVNHDGRGWWDATSSAKGDVFDLVQHLDSSLHFGQVRRILRGFVGVAPTYKPVVRQRSLAEDVRPPAERWAARPTLRRSDAAWTYLSVTRAIPDAVLTAAARQDCIRLGAYGSAWFAHRCEGAVSHVEIRSSTFKRSLRGGRKALFQFGEAGAAFRRLAVLEAPVDALSLAAIEQRRADTLYVATGGGMGPGTMEALQAILTRLRVHVAAVWRVGLRQPFHAVHVEDVVLLLRALDQSDLHAVARVGHQQRRRRIAELARLATRGWSAVTAVRWSHRSPTTTCCDVIF